MYKLFKVAFRLGYKFAERHYYQKLTENLKGGRELQMMEFRIHEASKQDKEYLQRDLDMDYRLRQLVDSAFRNEVTKEIYHDTIYPFQDDITNQL